MKLQELIIKQDGFYLGSQKIDGVQWPFTTCMGEHNTVKGGWVLCDDQDNIDRVYLSISQCCTGLLVTFYMENGLWRISIIQLPIVANEAVLSPTQNYYAALKVTGQACNGKGTIQISDGDKLWEWVIKEK
ncbi:MAG: hypothetical protein KBC98_00115 [Candidatus Pacebacteria bacterium]|nr:hypothetical protein [Candidatus Paceibacterota bacterium]